jgi:hypothetical protein
VSVVARLTRTLEELQLVERRLDELPLPNMSMVQGVAAGIDQEGKVRLGNGPLGTRVVDLARTDPSHRHGRVTPAWQGKARIRPGRCSIALFAESPAPQH